MEFVLNNIILFLGVESKNILIISIINKYSIKSYN